MTFLKEAERVETKKLSVAPLKKEQQNSDAIYIVAKGVTIYARVRKFKEYERIRPEDVYGGLDILNELIEAGLVIVIQ